MSIQALIVTYLYMVVPALSALIALFSFGWIVWHLAQPSLTRGGPTPVAWASLMVLAFLIAGNTWVFFQVYGVYAARSVLG